ncbi:hypothetical protein CRENBAI_011294 [Crenichthys baileyi]|uniref:Uncharacterized protein n=1 Tax=Crenichthys baileyi TaxID=28760 RepID=A0AAV9R897_9TELE
MEQWRTFPGVVLINESSRRSEKNSEQHLKLCRLHCLGEGQRAQPPVEFCPLVSSRVVICCQLGLGFSPDLLLSCLLGNFSSCQLASDQNPFTSSVGLTRVLEITGELLQNLQNLLVVLLFRAESIRGATLRGIVERAAMLAELTPVRQVRELPVQIQQVLQDLQELSKVLLQFVINTTPLYTMLEQSSPQEVEEFLNKEDFSDSSSRRSSANSLFLKTMGGRPRRRRSLYSRATLCPGSAQSPEPPNGRRSSTKESSTPEMDVTAHPSEGNAIRRPSATELLLTPLKHFVAQSQKALEYLSPNSSDGTGAVTETDDP